MGIPYWYGNSETAGSYTYIGGREVDEILSTLHMAQAQCADLQQNAQNKSSYGMRHLELSVVPLACYLLAYIYLNAFQGIILQKIVRMKTCN
jgi:hypothetical protein